MTKPNGRVNFTPPPDAPAAPDAAQQSVSVRVLPQGAGRVFTGEGRAETMGPEAGFPTYPRGAVFEAAAEVATELEARGFVEIQP